MIPLEFIDVCKRYPDGEREITVLDGVSLEIDDGDFVGVRGARKSGKTTLLEIAGGLLPVDSGQVRVCGMDLGSLSGDQRVKFLRDKVGLACADWRSHRRMPVVEYVATPLLSAGVLSRRVTKVRARAALDRVGALRHGEASTGALSLGESVRVELARALVAEPCLLLVDEPPVLRSPSEGKAIYELLKALGSEPDLAVMIASEDLELIQKAQRIMSISGGELRVMSEPGSLVPFPVRGAAQSRKHP
jgi:ABC-type lipoprotein export system ATPase subunit